MPATVPYTFANQTLADAPEVNANFTAVLAAINAVCPVGTFAPTGRSTAPPAAGGIEWVMCDGTLRNQVDWPELFDAIGTAFQPGATAAPPGQFYTPLVEAGRLIVGAGASGTYARGARSGSAEVTLTAGQMPAHAHEPEIAVAAGGRYVVTGGWPSGAANILIGNGGATVQTNAGLAGFTGSAGGNEAHPNMPPVLASFWMIRAK